MTSASDERPLAERMGPAHRVGHVAADVAHELNNRLQVILGNAELLEATLELPEAARRQLGRIVEAGRRASEANAALLALARDAGAARGLADERTALAFGDVADAQAARLATLAGTGAAFALELEPAVRALPLPDADDRAVLIELMSGLVLHARPAAASGTAVTLHARLVDDPEAEAAGESAPGTAPDLLCLHVDVALARGRAGDGTAGGRTDGTRDQANVDEGDDPARDASRVVARALDAGGSALVVDILTALLDRVGGRWLDGDRAGARTSRVAALPVTSRPPTA